MVRPKIIERVDLLENDVLDIYEILDNKMEKRSIDNTPTLDSEGLVTSDGIYRALLDKQDKLTIDSQLSTTSLNPIANTTVTYHINNLTQQIANLSSQTKTTNNFAFYTGSGNFVVPANVYQVLVMCIGGGGGGGWYHSTGGTGGQTSFGSWCGATGGTGGYDNEGGGSGGSGWARGAIAAVGAKGKTGLIYTYWGSESDSASSYGYPNYISSSYYGGNLATNNSILNIAPAYNLACGVPSLSPYYGQGRGWTGNSRGQGSAGGGGGSVLASVAVNPGETIYVTVGGGGSSFTGEAYGRQGCCYIQW